MPARFHLLYDRDAPERIGELTLDELITQYEHPPGRGGLAWLRTNFVATLDGSITGPNGRSGTINTVSDHRVFAVHRALADVILVGAETVRTERYRAVDLADWQRAVRAERTMAPFPTLAVVSRSLRLDPGIAEPDGPHGPVMIFTPAGAAERTAPFTAAGVEVVEVDNREGRVPLDVAVAALVDAWLPRILCEGGPRLHRDLLAADLVDELSLTLAPTVVGGEGQRSTTGAALPQQLPFRLQHLITADDDTVFTTYRRRRATDLL